MAHGKRFLGPLRALRLSGGAAVMIDDPTFQAQIGSAGRPSVMAQPWLRVLRMCVGCCCDEGMRHESGCPVLVKQLKRHRKWLEHQGPTDDCECGVPKLRRQAICISCANDSGRCQDCGRSVFEHVEAGGCL